MILALRSDTADATIMLFEPPSGPKPAREINQTTWTAARLLSNQLLTRIKQSLQTASAAWSDITGVIVFEGPGSFTGLRISITVANTIAYSLGCPVVGSRGQDWIEQGFETLKTARSGQIALPHYGSKPNITQSRA